MTNKTYALTTFLIIYASLLVLFTLMSLIRNDYWTFRVFDYPRLQKFVLSVICLGLILNLYEHTDAIFWVLSVAVSLNTIYLLCLIFPFTLFSKKQVLKVKKLKSDDSLSLMISNVYQYNDNYSGCLNEIKKADPDILLLLETDNKWAKATEGLDNDYSKSVKLPLDNTYGMLLFSKMELKDTEVRYMVEADVPSIHTKVILKSGQEVVLHCVHPTPPVPNENIRSTERDKELLLVADMAKAEELPVIVIGDLNDVAWSHTTQLFLKMSGLLDPRRGRGFYNTFSARNPFMRFPLDHAFISPDFKLNSMKRLNNFGSDHFPIFLSIQYEPQADRQQEPLHADSADVQKAQEKKAKV
jgi:endonuclease/exonuclease/phosphatase (EEP) superfamily protein YafD